MTANRIRTKYDDGRDGTEGDVPGCPIPGLDHIPTRKLPDSVKTIFFGGALFPLAHYILYEGYANCHPVRLSPFYISLKHVEEIEYNKLMGIDAPDNKYNSSVNVSWIDAVRYCNELSRTEGLTQCYKISGETVQCDWNANGYRLPSEAEFNYASPFFSFRFQREPDVLPQSLDASWFNFPNYPRGLQGLPGFGLPTWMWDLYAEDYHIINPLLDPIGPDEGDRRVVRHYRITGFPSNNSNKPYRCGIDPNRLAHFYPARSWIFESDVRRNNQLNGIPQWDRAKLDSTEIWGDA